MSRSKIISTNTSINPIESLLNILPCDRPIKSIQLIENVNECPSNYIPIHKTLDTDSDADILKENILFGKKNTRYLCISKTEGFDNFVVEKIKIISSSENLANEGFISIKNTTDTNQKAWRKKQLVYKLGKTDNLSEYITDIVVLTKFKSLPEGFVYLGELEKVHVCFKITPAKSTEIIDFTQQIENLKIQSNNLYPMTNNSAEHYYESLKLSYQLPASPPNRPTPLRAAPLPPTSPLNVDVTSLNVSNGSTNHANTGTLSHYHNDFIGIPFVLHPRITKVDCSFELPKSVPQSDSIEYDFNLERQILCSTKSENRKSISTNPFF